MYHFQYLTIIFILYEQKGGFDPTGFSGDIGEGAKTAYDVLPPKPWKEVAP